MCCIFTSRHVVPLLVRKQAHNLPTGQHDLKTAKPVFSPLRPPNLSKLQWGSSTAEERMARLQTAAYRRELITKIFREWVQFKGGLMLGPLTHAVQLSEEWYILTFTSLSLSQFFLHPAFLSILVCGLNHSISCYGFSTMMQGRGSCQRWAAGVMFWKRYKECCLG